MAFDFAKAKAQVRRIVHKTFGVQAFYQDDSLSSPVEIRARWHNKIELTGDLDNQMYAQLIQGIDRVIFDTADARKYGVKEGGEITFVVYGAGLGVSMGSAFGGEGFGPPAFVLRVREPNSGPIEEIWEVTRKELA